MWYGTSRDSGSEGKGGVEERKEWSGWENRDATSAAFKIGFGHGFLMMDIIEDSWGRLTRSVVSSIRTTTLWCSRKYKWVLCGSRMETYGVTIS